MATTSKKLQKSVQSVPKQPKPNFKPVSIADAKAKLSSLITRVETRRIPVTIMRRGVPVAQIIPLAQDRITSGYGWMRGTVQELGDIVAPTGAEWSTHDEYGKPYKDE